MMLLSKGVIIIIILLDFRTHLLFLASWGFEITHKDAPQSVGLLWTSVKVVMVTENVMDCFQTHFVVNKYNYVSSHVNTRA
jgi:hypothetical protein